MKLAKFYEEDWLSRKYQKFTDYKRNIALIEFFPPTKKNLQVLDLACGNGTVSLFLNKRGYDIIAIDISSEAIKQVKANGIKKAHIANIEEKLPVKSNSIDAVFWGDNIEHVIFPLQVLLEIKRVLKNNGRLIISTPNMGFFLYRWHFFKTGELPRTEGILSEPWEWKHIRFFNFNLLFKLLKKINFKITKVKGVNEPGIYKLLAYLSPKLFSSIIIVESRYLNDRK